MDVPWLSQQNVTFFEPGHFIFDDRSNSNNSNRSSSREQNSIHANCSDCNNPMQNDFSALDAIPKPYQVYVILLYTFTAIFTVLGNGTTLIVLGREFRAIRSIAKYLINLSCADLLMATSIPFVYTSFMYGRWIFPPQICSISSATQFYSAFVSVYTLIAIGIDRYIAIKTPLRSKTIGDLTNHIIGMIWFAGLLLSSVIFVLNDAVPYTLHNGIRVYVCEPRLNPDETKIVTTVIVAIIYLLPICILTYVYGTMAVVICHRDLQNSATTRLKQQRRKIIKILFVVVLAFFVCWSPLQIYLLLVAYFPSFLIYNTADELNRYVIICFASHLLAMAHSFVNPIVYSFMSESFRKQFTNLFCERLRRRKMVSSTRSKSTTVETMEYL